MGHVLQKVSSSLGTGFLGHCAAKNKDTGFEFCTPVASISLYVVYSGF